MLVLVLLAGGTFVMCAPMSTGIDCIDKVTNCPPADDGGADGPVDGGTSGTSGIFVSPTGSDSNAGTQASPVRTLAHALDLAKTNTPHRVNACAGTYPEHVVIDAAHDGVSLYGGYACADWSYAPATNAVKVAPTDPGPALKLDTLTAGTTVEDMELDAVDAQKAGDSSIAIFANAAQSSTLRRVTAKGGNGAAGAAGADGASMSNYNVSLSQSDPSIEGHSASGQAPGGTQACAGLCANSMSSTGGSGGQGDTTGPKPGADGGPPIPSSGVFQDGAGGTWAGKCNSGDQGASAADAPTGGGPSTALGSATALGWTPSDGQAGTAGGPGQGGGGGSGGISATSGGGGGGGCGGCGGSGGGGGHGGGSSFALLSVGSTLTLEACVLTAGNGADGGKGGAGQPGQQGGAAGAPATLGIGCPGGLGGTGGGGSGGGGGTGGVSVAVGYTGMAPAMTGGTMASAGQPGHGGAGGEGSTPADAGASNAGAKGLEGVAASSKGF